MKKLALLAALLGLAGCQSVSIEQLQATVGNASNFQLCRAIFLAPNNVASIAREEAARRSLDCSPYAAAVFQEQAQQQAQRDAATNALTQQLLTPKPAPNFGTTCRTVRMGNSLETQCY